MYKDEKIERKYRNKIKYLASVYMNKDANKGKKEHRKHAFYAFAAEVGWFLWLAMNLKDKRKRAKSFKYFKEAIGMGETIDVGYNWKTETSLIVGRPIRLLSEETKEEEYWATFMEPTQTLNYKRLTEIKRGHVTGRWTEKEINYRLCVGKVKYVTRTEKDKDGNKRKVQRLEKSGTWEWTFGDFKIKWMMPEWETELTDWNINPEILIRYEGDEPKKLPKDPIDKMIKEDNTWRHVEWWARDNAKEKNVELIKDDSDGKPLLEIEKESYYPWSYDRGAKRRTLEKRIEEREKREKENDNR